MPVIFQGCDGSVFWVHPAYPAIPPASAVVKLEPLVNAFNPVWNSKGASGASGK